MGTFAHISITYANPSINVISILPPAISFSLPVGDPAPGDTYIALSTEASGAPVSDGTTWWIKDNIYQWDGVLTAWVRTSRQPRQSIMTTIDGATYIYGSAGSGSFGAATALGWVAQELTLTFDASAPFKNQNVSISLAQLTSGVSPAGSFRKVILCRFMRRLILQSL